MAQPHDDHNVIQKFATRFKVMPGTHCYDWWFREYLGWEPATFVVLDTFLGRNPNGIYVDIGAWIGPTVLYAAAHCNTVYALEPDPVALKALTSNIDANGTLYKEKIIVVDKALDVTDGFTKFGGNGDLGNSMSTMIVREECYSTGNARKSQRRTITTEVGTISLQTLCSQYPLVSSATLFKMDIEGGEKYLLPHLQHFFKDNRIPLLISLHWCWLKAEDVVSVIQIIFSTFEHVYIRDKLLWIKVDSADTVIRQRSDDLVCTFEEVQFPA